MKSLKYNEMLKSIEESDDWYIYGAGIIGYDISLAIERVYGYAPKAFIVSDANDQKRKVGIKPVYSLEELIPCLSNQTIILIATPEEYHAEIRQKLNVRGLNQVYCIDSDLEYEIMTDFFTMTDEFPSVYNLTDHPGKHIDTDKLDIGVYMAKCHVDRKLTGTYIIPKWITPIQVGTQRTDQRIASICDNQGMNISDRNNNFSELTATFWVWKNTNHDYKGICHYRRILSLSATELSLIVEKNIDVILPYPFVCQNSSEEQYNRYINQDNFQLAMDVLKRLYPEYYDAAVEIFQGRYIYNYNMLIAKRDVFDQYCEWLFQILFDIEQINNNRKASRSDRYLGYLGEILTSLYFLYHKNNRNIIHAKKIWMV